MDGGPGPFLFPHPRWVSVPPPHPREDSVSWDLIPEPSMCSPPLTRAGGLLAEGQHGKRLPKEPGPLELAPPPPQAAQPRLERERRKEGPARPRVSQGRGRVSVGRASHENLMPPCRLLIFVCFSLFARREASFISPDCHYPALNFHRAGREAGQREAGRGVGWGLPGLGLWGAETSSPACPSAHC